MLDSHLLVCIRALKPAVTVSVDVHKDAEWHARSVTACAPIATDPSADQERIDHSGASLMLKRKSDIALSS